MIRVSASTTRGLARWNEAPALFDAMVGTAIEVTSLEGVAMLTEIAPKGATRNLSLGFSVKSPIAEPDRIRGGITNPTPYAYYADQGRKPGKMPPREPIEEWVQNKLGVKASGWERDRDRAAAKKRRKKSKRKPRQTRAQRRPRGPRMTRQDRRAIGREALVFLIQRSIGQHGTYADDGPPKFIEAVEKKLQPRLEYHVGNAVGELERRLSSR